MEESMPRCRERWEIPFQKLEWPIKWEREKPPHDLKVLEMIQSISKVVKYVPSPIEISEAVEMARELKGLLFRKIEAIVKFLGEVPAKLAHLNTPKYEFNSSSLVQNCCIAF